MNPKEKVKNKAAYKDIQNEYIGSALTIVKNGLLKDPNEENRRISKSILEMALKKDPIILKRGGFLTN